MKINQLSNHLLIATPALTDPIFANTVVYIDSHDKSGAHGYIINKTLPTTLAKVLKHLDIVPDYPRHRSIPIFDGGPMKKNQGVVISPANTRNTPNASLVAITSNKRLLEHIAKGKGPKDYMVVLGSSHWSADQLETEIIRNDWLTAPCNLDILFHTSIQKRRQLAAQLISVNLSHLTGETGHA
jgi:putative transcriptional regulator